MTTALRKGWCPSALRPMASGDGLIVRLSVDDGVMAPSLARALTRLSRQFGNGLFDLSARANLQLRGVSEATLAPLQAELRALGLIEADEAPAVVHNILTSPLAGIGPQAVLEIGPCVRALRERLRHDEMLHRLPAKFGFAIDDGSALSVAGENMDVSFLAQRGAGAPYFLVCLAGKPAGRCAIDELPDIGQRVAHAFLELRNDAERRMAHLVRRVAIEAIATKAGLAATADCVAEGRASRPIGTYRVGQTHVLGLGVPFGRLDASTLEKLADVAEMSGGALRLTPWRAILIVGTQPPDAPRLGGTRLIFGEDDPLRAVAACPGAPSCANGTTATQDDARQLAPLARRLKEHGIAVHVSGCVKGCAFSGATPVTLVGREGRYDLVYSGKASDKPALVGLDISEVHLALQNLLEKIDA